MSAQLSITRKVLASAVTLVLAALAVRCSDGPVGPVAEITQLPRDLTAAEQELIQRAQAGEGRAREQLFRQFIEPVFATAYRLTGNRADAEDIAQESFVRALSRIGDFEGRSSFRTWLYRILLNVAYDHFRKTAKERTRARVEQVAAQVTQTKGAGASPPEAASGREERELLRALLEELPEKQRVAVTLVYLDGMNCQEAAAVMEASQGTVYWWLQQARKHLARRLGSILGRADRSGEADRGSTGSPP